MATHQHDEDSGVMLVGGELPGWSDRPSGAPRRDAITTLVHHLVVTSRPATALLVGARALDLVDVVDVEGTSTTAVARGLKDVRDVAAARPRVHLVAGALDRLPHAERFDLVVALGGPAALQAPDSTGWSTRELLADLAKRLTPSGLLVADVPNGLGAGRFTELPEPVERSNAAFTVGMPGIARRGLWLRELPEAVNDAGLKTVTTYAMWPSLATPAVVVSDASLGTDQGSAVAGWAASRAARAQGRAPALADLETLAEDAFAAGQAMTLAPGWLVIASASDARPKVVPGLVVDETWAAPELARTIVDDLAGVLTAWAPATAAEGWRRTPELPRPGPRLDASVRDALRVGDRHTTRALLHAYAAWLGAAHDQESADSARERLVALPGNVTVLHPAPALEQGPVPPSVNGVPQDAAGRAEAPSLQVADPSWVPTDPSVVATLDLGLFELATQIVTTAQPHPFGPGRSTTEVARELAVLAGTTFAPDQRAGARAIDAAAPGPASSATVPKGDADERTLSDRLAEFVPTGLVTQHPTGPGADTPAPPTVAAYLELRRACAAATDALAIERAKSGWLEGTLRAREREIGVLERSVAVESSAVYQVFKQLSRPVPALRRRARAALDRARTR